MSRGLSTLCACLIVASPTEARAFHPLVTDDAGTLGPARLEVELALAAEGEGGSPVELEQTWSVHLGLGTRLDVGATLVAAAGGQLSAQSSAKLRLLEQSDEGLALAVRFDLAPPWMSGGAGLPGLGALVVGSWESSGSALHVNAGSYCEGERGQGVRCHVVWALAALLFPVEGLALGVDVTHELASTEEQSLAGQVIVAQALGGAGSLSLGVGLGASANGSLGWKATVGYTFAVGGAPRAVEDAQAR